MNCIGIIAEYNPFHIGHAHQLVMVKTKYPDALIVVAMSGSFVQRGEPALFDKFSRARWALLNGAHAVVELPTVYATANAERFAAGGVRLLAKLGVTTLAFGSENDNAEVLWQMASLSRSEEVQSACRTYLQEGLSYGSALRRALHDIMPDAVHNGPNTLLALEYIKAIQAYKLSMDILPIKRTSSHHATDVDVTAPSGSALRQAISTPVTPTADSLKADSPTAGSTTAGSPTANSPIERFQHIQPAFPPSIRSEVKDLLSGQNVTDYALYESLCHFESRRQHSDDLLKYPDFSEGLHTLWTKAGAATDWSAAVEMIKSKRYTYARLRRMGSYTVLNLTKGLQDQAHSEGPLYGRLLGFTDEARHWLKSQSSQFPIVQKWSPFVQTATGLAKNMALLDTRATDIRALCEKNPELRKGHMDYMQSPLYVPTKEQ